MLRLSFLYQASLLSFPELCQFWMEKKEFTVEIQILYGSSYFLIHERPFHVIPNDNIVKQHGIYVFRVDDRNNRTRCDSYLKLKLKNKYIRMTLPNSLMLSYSL